MAHRRSQPDRVVGISLENHEYDCLTLKQELYKSRGGNGSKDHARFLFVLSKDGIVKNYSPSKFKGKRRAKYTNSNQSRHPKSTLKEVSIILPKVCLKSPSDLIEALTVGLKNRFHLSSINKFTVKWEQVEHNAKQKLIEEMERKGQAHRHDHLDLYYGLTGRDFNRIRKVVKHMHGLRQLTMSFVNYRPENEKEMVVPQFDKLVWSIKALKKSPSSQVQMLVKEQSPSEHERKKKHKRNNNKSKQVGYTLLKLSYKSKESEGAHVQSYNAYRF